MESSKLLLAKGANMDARNHSGYTPLHFAVEDNSVALVQLLIDHGAGIDIKDRKEETPLDYARKKGFNDCAAVLEKAGISNGDMKK